MARGSKSFFYLYSEYNPYDGCKHLQIGFVKLPHEKTFTKKEFFEELDRFLKKEWNRIKRFQTTFTLQIPEDTKRQAKQNYKHRWKIFKRDDFKCQNCDRQEDLELDHIIPLSQGGEDSESNMQTLCKTCNLKKMHTQKVGA